MVYVKQLIWEKQNIAHIARHDIAPNEVDEVCKNKHCILDTYQGRKLLTGISDSGKIISIVLAPKGDDIYYPVTARPASRKERQYFRQQGGEKRK